MRHPMMRYQNHLVPVDILYLILGRRAICVKNASSYDETMRHPMMRYQNHLVPVDILYLILGRRAVCVKNTSSYDEITRTLPLGLMADPETGGYIQHLLNTQPLDSSVRRHLESSLQIYTHSIYNDEPNPAQSKVLFLNHQNCNTVLAQHWLI